jgi:hypothetical protein
MMCVICKEAAGEGADRHTRGRVCSPEGFAAGLGGGRDARAPRTLAVRRFKMMCVICKEAAGEGADRHTRGRVCSPEGFAPGLGEELALRRGIANFARCGKIVEG